MSSSGCFCCRPMNLYPVKFVVPSKKVVFFTPRRIGVRASMVDGSSNFVHRMERAWVISQVTFIY